MYRRDRELLLGYGAAEVPTVAKALLVATERAMAERP
jgi:hypothetical protein